MVTRKLAFRQRFAEPRASLHELFARLTFNIVSGNTDDHARNHAAFWDGKALRLTPAYDVCPQPRTGQVAGQAMLIIGTRNDSRLALCVEAAPAFQLRRDQARAIIERQIDTIRGRWEPVCDEAGLPAAGRQTLWGRQFLNPYAFEGWEEG